MTYDSDDPIVIYKFNGKNIAVDFGSLVSGPSPSLNIARSSQIGSVPMTMTVLTDSNI
jgi:hypothetical protein